MHWKQRPILAQNETELYPAKSQRVQKLEKSANGFLSYYDQASQQTLSALGITVMA